MMIKNFTPLLTLLLIVFSLSTFAQSRPLRLSPELQKPFKQAKFRTERIPAAGPQTQKPSAPIRSRTEKEVIIGTTRYDLQTNSSCGNRLQVNDDGTMSAVWTMGFNDGTGFSDRGTGYNRFNGDEWGAQPTVRVENVRTGWPEIGLTTPGKEVVMSHLFDPPVKLHLALRDANTSGAWAESNVPHIAVPGVVWPRMAVGGDNGNTIHAIGTTFPTANGGGPYRGMEGHLLYFRSRDGGSRWEKTDVILPGVDSSEYNFVRADAYALHARGNTVAVLVLSSWGDIKLIKSTDNGDTWTQTIIHDFPLQDYEINDGYTENDIPVDPDAPSALAIYTTDEAGTVVIDAAGMVHIAYTTTYVEDSDLTDEGWTYYPGTYGLYYWNESYGTGGAKLVGGLPDSNGNGELDITGWGDYGQSILSFPSIGVNEDGGVFIAYSGLVEAYENANANPEPQTYRHVLIIGSEDGGENWTAPYDIINPEISDPDFFSFFEGAFPSMAKNVNDKIHLIYQQDTEPGLNVQGDDADPVEFNNIVYVGLDVAEFFRLTANNEIEKPIADFQVFPNPAQTQFEVLFSLKNAGQVRMEMINSLGATIDVPIPLASFSSGNFRQTVTTGDLPKGIYFLKMKMDEQVMVRKIFLQ